MWFRKSQSDDDSVKALEEAKEHLMEVSSRSKPDEVYSLAASLRNLRETNHFAETVVDLMRWG